MHKINNKLTRKNALAISLLAALPLLLVQLVFLSDTQGWTESLGYGLLFIMIPVFAGCWVLYLCAEIALRFHFLGLTKALPAFSLVAAVALATFFFVGDWARPLVLQNPKWCRVTQVIEYPHHRGDFVLVLIARGNLDEHRFVSGYLNWSGDELAGVSSIKLDPITFEWWKSGERLTTEGSYSALQKRVADSGLPDAETERLTNEIWGILQAASGGQDIEAAVGTVKPPTEMPFSDEHLVLGGVLWLAGITLLYMIAGQLTLTTSKQE